MSIVVSTFGEGNTSICVIIHIIYILKLKQYIYICIHLLYIIYIYIHIACIYNIHVIISKMAWGSPVFPSRCSFLPLLQVLTVRKRLGRTRTWDLTRAGQAQHKLTSFFLEFSKTHVFLPKMKCTSKIVSGICVGDINVGFFQEFLVPEVDNAGDFNAAGRLSNRGFKSSRNLISVNNKAELHSRMYSTRIFLTYFLWCSLFCRRLMLVGRRPSAVGLPPLPGTESATFEVKHSTESFPLPDFLPAKPKSRSERMEEARLDAEGMKPILQDKGTSC